MAMGFLISESQYAFFPGRQILDCVLVANEAIDSVSKSKEKGVAFKVDFQKAYDTVSWDFLLKILQVCGFGNLWCQWIQSCISSTFILVIVNGSPIENFPISRGLRQGCSLSPLLFNLVGEALNLMLRKASQLGLFEGFKIGRSVERIQISHLQFADDLLIFCGASEIQIKNVKRVLQVLEISSWLKLNMSKSKLFGINVSNDCIEAWANSIGSLWGKLPTDYLGLPLGAKRNSIALWKPVIQKFHHRLEGWQPHILSIGGRLMLIRSVLTSLPLCFLSIFKIPVSVTKKFNSMMATFLWVGSNSSHKVHWVNWQRLCLPLSAGGLGINNIETLNWSLLYKRAMRYGNETHKLWRRLITAKTQSDPAGLLPIPCNANNVSWIWNSIAKNYAKEDQLGKLFRDNLSLQVGYGSKVLFWDDVWCSQSLLKEAFPKVYALSIKKSGFINDFGGKFENRWVWNIPLRRSPFDWETE
ncbi:hypothetical protein HRI_003186500 [Hibiscus trionum]|uniref:Reverse transcriptase domain-containing protein n=1 Tax=Hibiscus trionum TaxID=183268 RepID=A0A9W7IEW8_HIBTR|nr:hypothetical protein HRI_003186500 [Hibiscus trionum]